MVVSSILFYRLSPSSQRRAKLFALGGVAIFLTTFLGYWLIRLVPLLPTLAASTGVLFLLLPLIFVGALASGFWYELFHVLKTGRTRFL